MDQFTDPAAALRGRKPRGQGASRRGEILQAAKHLFAEEGVAHVTMRRIGAAVGVSPTALYMHFADKDALLSAIAQDTFTALLERLEETKIEGASARVQFRAGLRAYVQFGLERPDEYRLTFMSRLFRRSEPRTCAIEMADRSFALLQDHVTELMRDGTFQPGVPALTAEAIWAMLHGVTALLLDQADNLETPRAALIEASLDLLEAGLVGPGGRKKDGSSSDKPC
jgi:AcrR family transcriptional regulator